MVPPPLTPTHTHPRKRIKIMKGRGRKGEVKNTFT